MSWRQRLAGWISPTQTLAADPVNVALVDAYTSLTWQEREYMIGRLRDSALGIQRRPLLVNSRWTPKDRDSILHECEQGSMLRLSIFCDAMRSDGVFSGLMGTRTSGLLRRPVLFSGDTYICDELKGVDPVRDETGMVVNPGRPGLFKRLCPTAEAAQIIWDGIVENLGLGEMVSGPDGVPCLRHLDTHWVRYEYPTGSAKGRLIYQAPGGTYEIRPGDGRWVVFCPRGFERFWAFGSWYPLAWPFVQRASSALDLLRWQGQLADPLKVIELGQRASDREIKNTLAWVRDKWHRAAAWVARAGEKAYLAESNGIGWQVYKEAGNGAAEEMQYVLSGQLVTGSGNKGFSDGDEFFATKDGINQETAEAWSECVGRDILGPVLRRFYGARPGDAKVAWDVESPAQRQARLEALGAAVEVIGKADQALAGRGLEVDLDAFEEAHRVEIPVRPKGGAAPGLPPGSPPALPPPQGPPPGDDEAPQEPDDAARLAEKMTANRWARCEHGSLNRCRLCGIERVRDAEPGPDGQPVWAVRWKPIQAGGAPSGGGAA